MPLLGRGHIGPSGREVPSAVFHGLSTWHLVPQWYSRKSLHDAGELRSNYRDGQMHQRLMQVLRDHQGHHILAQTEAAKIACSDTAAEADIVLDCIAPGLAVPLAPEALEDTLASALGAIVACAQECVAQAGITPDKMQAVYLTGGSSALAPLGEALARVFPQATLTVGDRFTSVAAGLAYGGAALGAGAEILDEIAA